MSVKILTNLKKMSKLLTIDRFWGPVITVVFTVVYHLTVGYFGVSLTLAWLYLFLVIGAFVGGLRAALVCAAWMGLYAIYALPMEPGRIVQIIVVAVAIAGAVGYLRKRERRLQEVMTFIFANGNVQKMRDALALATDLKHHFRASSDRVIEQGLERIESDLGNTLAVLDGYKFLREEIERVNHWYADPHNVKRLQEMKEAEGDG